MNHLASFSSNQIKWKSCVARATLGDVLACSVVLLNQHSFIFHIIYKDQIFSQWNLYTLWFCCSVLYTWCRLTYMYIAGLSLLCGSSWGLFKMLPPLLEGIVSILVNFPYLNYETKWTGCHSLYTVQTVKPINIFEMQECCCFASMTQYSLVLTNLLKAAPRSLHLCWFGQESELNCLSESFFLCCTVLTGYSAASFLSI